MSATPLFDGNGEPRGAIACMLDLSRAVPAALRSSRSSGG